MLKLHLRGVFSSWRWLRVAIAVAGALILLGACSDSGVSEEDLQAVEAERDRLQVDLAGANAQRDQLQDGLDALTAERDSLQESYDALVAERDGLQESLSGVSGQRDGLTADLSSMTEERDALISANQDLDGQVVQLRNDLGAVQASLTASETEVRNLLSQYDTEIRADLQAAIDAEVERVCALAVEQWREPVDRFVRWMADWSPITSVEEVVASAQECATPGRERAEREFKAGIQAEVDAEIERACAEAAENYEDPVGGFVRWDSDWLEVTTRPELVNDVRQCAEPQRSRTEEQRRQEFLNSCQRINVDEVEKNPNGLRGECFVMFAYVVQYDTATGACGFHAELNRNRSTRWWDYDVRSVFGYRDDVSTSFSVGVCPELENIDSEDFIRVWGTVLGTYTYSSITDATITVPSFRIESVELVRKN